MPDRHGGSAVDGADTAPILLAPGLSATRVRRWLVAGYLVTIATYLLLSTPRPTITTDTPLTQLVWLAVVVVLIRAGWLARSFSGNAVERRFWTYLLVAAACVAASQATYVVEILASGPKAPPLASLSTVFDVVSVLALLGMLMSLARFRQSTWAARARFLVDIVAAGVVVTGALDAWVVGPAFVSAGNRVLEGALYSAYPVIGAFILAGTLRVVIGTRSDRWKPWERQIGAVGAAFAFALIALPAAYMPPVVLLTGGWSPVVVDATLLTGLYLALSATVSRLADHAIPWHLRPLATLEPSYGWISAVVLPSLELLAIPVFGLAAFQTEDPAARSLRLVVVGIVSVLLALRTLLAIADSEALLSRADTDPLTGLVNHGLFHERLGDELERSLRHGEVLGLIAIDVDDFGAVNSLGGHIAGDTALVGVARALEAAVRAQDVVCRVGGDELMVIVPGADTDAAFASARRIVESVRSATGGEGRTLSVSAGVAVFPQHARDRDALVAAADAALYWAKRHGKDRAVMYDPVVATPTSLERRMRDLREHADLDAVRALAAAVDARDASTRDHSRNVSRLAAALARELGLDDETVTLMGHAGLLHDVGKIGVPDAILKKRGSLTEQERVVLRDHAALGAQILGSTAMTQVPPWVRHHHERWDGEGYPDRLAGEAIPLGARIIAVAEAYDSVISGRFGRQPLTPRAALQHIDLELGDKFDPVVGERFIRMVTAQLVPADEGGDR